MKNTYFNDMANTLKDYTLKLTAAQEKRDAFFKEEKYAEGTKVMHDFEISDPHPYSRGQMAAYFAYLNTMDRGSNCFEVDRLPWNEAMPDFVETLRQAGIKKFAVTDNTTGLMDGIYELIANGCKMGKLKMVTRKNSLRWNDNQPETVKGIEFRVEEARA